MRKKIIIGNWKMNKSTNDVVEFFRDFKEFEGAKNPDLIFGIALPHVHLVFATSFKQQAWLKNSNFVVVAQDLSEHESGAYTGEVSASMIRSVEATYVIVGHSERRTYHNESNELVNRKAQRALRSDLIPIICVGETLAEYEEKKSQAVVKKQVLESTKNLDLDKIVIAYEPVWAIGTGKTATVEYAQEMCAFIRSLTSEKTLIQYGGSVTTENIEQLLLQPDIDGALVGGASLKPDSFTGLIPKKKSAPLN